jgi:hypothetical protein
MLLLDNAEYANGVVSKNWICFKSCSLQSHL